MNRSTFDDILQDLNIGINDNKTTTNTKNQRANFDPDDDWLATPRDTKKSTTNIAASRQNDSDDLDVDVDDKWNQTGGSNFSYVPNFGAQGQDTIQRIVNQPRPATSSGTRKYDDLFGTSPPKTTMTSDMDKNKKTVRFDENDSTRPTTAPPSSDLLQHRSGTGTIATMRTGLEPNKSFSMSSPNKPTATTESNNSNDWLGLKDESSDEDEFPIRPPQKTEPVTTTLAKKTPLLSVPEPPPKKSVLDDLLNDDRRALTEKTPVVPTVTSKITSQNLWFDDEKISDKRSSTANTQKTLLFQDTQQNKPSTKTPLDSKTDFSNITFKDSGKDSLFTNESPISTATRSNSSAVNLDMKRLEYENNELRMTLDHVKRQYEVERTMLEEGYKHRIEYVEKSCERRESRFKEENEHLLRQINDRTQQYENEKSALLLDHQRRLDELQRDRTIELENLRTLQRAFESVVDHMEQNAKNIDELRLKIEAKHSSALSDKEIEARAKEQQLKAYEERLHMQSNDFERERKNLQELIARLEVHLSEQTKLVEEERWKALQAQKRMEAMQDALNGEQRLFTEKIARDRSEIQRGKDLLLEDQKVALASVYESRSQLANERAKIEALQKTFQEQKQRDMLQAATVEAEARAQQKVLSEQMARLDKREQEIIKREETLLIERRSLTELKQRVEIEQSTVKNDYEEIKQKLIDIEHANDAIRKEKERLSQLYFELHALDGKNTGRLQQLQQSIQTLRHQEEHMSEQYSRMADERPNRNHLRSSVTLSSQSPLKDTGFSTMQLVSATPLLPTTSSQQSIEESVALRTLRMNALQDQLYIQDEMSFLSSLRAGNPLLSRTGASHGNLHRLTDYNLLRTNH
ncbi:hypothetical protein I4U23_018940 [Adineta vaga]|nr:hypothetical protein I4U23_018940 [Adineta vaga]